MATTAGYFRSPEHKDVYNTRRSYEHP
ncbi:unnamed protein product, partial [Allacma fusca]